MSESSGKRSSSSVGFVLGVVLLVACADNAAPPGGYVPMQLSGAGAGAPALPMAGQPAAGGAANTPNTPNTMIPPVNPMGMMPVVMQGAAGMMPRPSGMGGMGGMGAAGGTGGSMQPVAPPGEPIERGDEPTEASATRKGPYNVESYTSGFRAPMQYGGGTIWYPTDAEPPFAIVAVCPGFTAPQALIAGWGPFLASHGIVTITIDTITPLDSVDQRAPALMDAVGGVQAENMRSGSPLMGKLDLARISVMGWSMGGGGTWINAATHPELKSAISLAGHILTSPANDLSTIKVPTLMLAGALDTAILGGGMSQPVYDTIPDSTPKMIYEVASGDHNIGNDPGNNGGAIGRYGLAWQKVFLEGDARYRKFLLAMGPGASDFRTNVK